jgi:hypothetical protein
VFGFLADKMLVAQAAYAATCRSASPCGPSPRCYWLWYVVPLGALLGGTLFGSLIYGAYGLTRNAGIWLLLLLLLTPAAADPEWVVTEVLGRAGAARSVAGAVLVFVGAFTAGAFARGSLA